MRICYTLLSPTFGMHQYTADIANRMAYAGHEVHLVTTTSLPRDRYAPMVNIHTPLNANTTGFSPEGFRVRDLYLVYSAISDLQPDLVHFTGPHLWNVGLLRALGARGIPIVHTMHDLDPHEGTRLGSFLRLWNWLVVHSAHHILVHGQAYYDRLIAAGVPAEQLTYTPLLHLFVGQPWMQEAWRLASQVRYEPWALFFGRLERYKGVDRLLTACAMMSSAATATTRVVLAGPGDLAALWCDPIPRGVEVRNRLIQDDEALDLFRRCALLVLPYLDATQSALIAAAYFFRKPVLITRTGALPEYVEDGYTGSVMEPDHPASFARCLEEMVSDPVRLAQMGSAGRLWYDIQRTDEMRTLTDMYLRLAHQESFNAPVGSFALGGHLG